MDTDMKTFEAGDRESWRAWLAGHHDRESEIWLVYYKKASGVPSISYEESVEEAIAYGWVDSLIKKIDEHKYTRKFTPRKPESVWSVSNVKRAEKVIAAGRMTEHGMALIQAAKSSGAWQNPKSPPKPKAVMPAELEQALSSNKKAKAAFDNMPPSHRKEYMLWVGTAKREDTRLRRVAKSIEMLAKGKQLGLK
jgi:uncharacterized protein YdeI (YjbR/CyaY-like superfamily)